MPHITIKTLFKRCFEFINFAISSGGKVLVHCYAGISRSATVVIAYLMSTQDKSFREAYDFVKSKRSEINPNEGFIK